MSGRFAIAGVVLGLGACSDPAITVRAVRATVQQSVAVRPCDGGCPASSVFDGTGSVLSRTVGFFVHSASEQVTLQWTTGDAISSRCDAFTVAYSGSPLSFEVDLSSTLPANVVGCSACSAPVPCAPFLPDGGGTDGGTSDAGSPNDGGGSGTDAGSTLCPVPACTQGLPSTFTDESINTNQSIVGAWTSCAGDIWAVASFADAGSLWHYLAGAGWTHVVGLDSQITYSSIWGTGPADIWIAGTLNPTGNPSYPIVIRGDGLNAWVDAGPDPSQASVQNGVFSAIWGASPSDVWVGGSNHGGGPSMLHWDGARWQDESATISATEQINGLSGSSASDVWAVGGMVNGEAIHRSGTPAWFSTGSFPNAPLLSVWAYGSLAWAGASVPMASSGDVFDWDGGGWAQDPTSSNDDARAIWASGPADVWVGLGPWINYFDGSSWHSYGQVPCNNFSGIYAIAGTCSDLRFLGAYGKICHVHR